MTDWTFGNGIKIHIPDCDKKETQIKLWTDVKMAMSLLLDRPEPVEPKTRKPYPIASWTEKRRKKASQAVKAYHRMKKKQ